MKLSIVTPCLNRREMIGAAIESVLSQRDFDFEHWIIDGGSTDGTLEFVKRYPHLKVFSEPDRGVYDGFNKGIDRATGDVVAFLNSDDVYAPGAFRFVREGYARGATEIVTGGCEIFRRVSSGSEIIMHRYLDSRRYRLSVASVTLGVPNINARFFRRRVFDKIGKFSLEYKMAADREFLLRLALAGISDYPIERLFYRYQWHAGSLTMNSGNTTLLKAINESVKIADEYRSLSSISSRDRSVLEAWRRELQATVFMIHAVQGKPGAAFDMAAEALKEDPRWIFDLLRCGTQSVGRRVRTLLRTVLAKTRK
jgi:glycosyltransferase involved in cell wall biosynthesis